MFKKYTPVIIFSLILVTGIFSTSTAKASPIGIVPANERPLFKLVRHNMWQNGVSGEMLQVVDYDKEIQKTIIKNKQSQSEVAYPEELMMVINRD